jgi:hypothetical protein
MRPYLTLIFIDVTVFAESSITIPPCLVAKSCRCSLRYASDQIHSQHAWLLILNHTHPRPARRIGHGPSLLVSAKHAVFSSPLQTPTLIQACSSPPAMRTHAHRTLMWTFHPSSNSDPVYVRQTAFRFNLPWCLTARMMLSRTALLHSFKMSQPSHQT